MVRRKNFSRLLLAILVSGILIGSSTMSGTAQRPDEVDDSFTIEGLCDFPVLVELHGKAKTIFLRDGRIIATSPGLEATFTNLDAPERTASEGITGAFRLTELANGDTEFIVTGRNLLVGLDSESRFLITMGVYRFVLDVDGNVVETLTGHGREIDVCELLE